MCPEGVSVRRRAKQRATVFGCLPLVALAVTLVGCATPSWLPGQRDDVAVASETTLYLDAVRALIAQRQYYAAIAHIEEDRRLHGDTPELRLLEADARRNLRQNKTAESLYHSVLRGNFSGPLAPKARQGLGLLYAPVNIDAAIKELAEASRLKPTDATIRSDYGYALMQARRFSEARAQLSTAAELDPASVPARNNLLILLFALGDETGARHVAAKASLDESQLARLKAQGQSLRTPRPAAKPAR
jgi:Flp pilus assembly protein TadD